MVAHRSLTRLVAIFAFALLATLPRAQTPTGNPAPGKSDDLDLVQKLLTARRDYQKTLEQLRYHYHQAGNVEKMKWAEEELKLYHRIPHQAFRLDLDVPPPNLKGDQNVVEANKLFTWAMHYKDQGFGENYIDNQRRAEILFQEILSKYPHSDKISDVAYMLGDLYESKAYRMYYRAVEYYQRSYQWNPKRNDDARLRAARLYDRQLNNRAKAIEIYREITTNETDPRRIAEAQKRIAELSGAK